MNRPILSLLRLLTLLLTVLVGVSMWIAPATEGDRWEWVDRLVMLSTLMGVLTLQSESERRPKE